MGLRGRELFIRLFERSLDLGVCRRIQRRVIECQIDSIWQCGGALPASKDELGI
jgi:hypothetical protein